MDWEFDEYTHSDTPSWHAADDFFLYRVDYALWNDGTWRLEIKLKDRRKGLKVMRAFVQDVRFDVLTRAKRRGKKIPKRVMKEVDYHIKQYHDVYRRLITD